MHTLEAIKRDKKDSLEKIRKEGFIPAVFYGPKEESTPIKIKSIDFQKAYDAAGESTVVTLKEGGNEHETLIHDIDFDPVKGFPRHADFYVIEKGKKVEVSVPLEFVNESPGEKAGGILVKVLHEIDIEASPKDLPSEIEVDISVLTDIGSQIHVRDLKIPSGVELKSDLDETVALIQEAKEEVEEETEAPDLSSIEVEGEKKPEEEQEAEEGK